MSVHEQSVGRSDEWYTPPHIFEAMGVRFDMDVASPGLDVTPWIPADTVIVRNALNMPWQGFVWMNPPFGARNGLTPWLEKFVAHGNGVALVPDRTSAPWWQWFAPRVELMLFVAPKIRFISGDGAPNASPAQGTVLCAIGQRGRDALANARRLGVLASPLFAEVQP